MLRLEVVATSCGGRDGMSSGDGVLLTLIGWTFALRLQPEPSSNNQIIDRPTASGFF